MLKEIAQVLDLPYPDLNAGSTANLHRILQKMPVGAEKLDPSGIAFRKHVVEAEKKVLAEGAQAIDTMVATVTADPAARVYKIKRSPKGIRIKVAAANGVRYSFGPIWNDSVIKGKGIAVAQPNREKLNHHALMLGAHPTPEILDVNELCAKMSKFLVSEA